MLALNHLPGPLSAVPRASSRPWLALLPTRPSPPSRWRRRRPNAS